ncbi:MAG: DUF4143 domain-containing protein [Candidatus Accumulibacter sp.]|jgi:predicted AAA+ superfamily ATPase|nr:DUF4143 domain-containing protein [Accumulibacter sp.]
MKNAAKPADAAGAARHRAGEASGHIDRHIERALGEFMAELPALILTGPRGCGKTTSALRLARSVLRLDRPEEAAALRGNPDALLAAQEKPLLIDEWQAAPEVMGALKRAVDRSGAAGQYLITGSVRSRLLPDGWPATGRVVPLAMYGLTVGELERHSHAATLISRLFGEEDPKPGAMASAPDVTQYVADALAGGFPDAVRLSERARAVWYEGYVEQLVRHDAAMLAQVRSRGGLMALLRAAALNTAGLPSLKTLAEAARVDHRTVNIYLDLLEDLRIVERIPAWSGNLSSRLVKTQKLYMVDSGMAAHLSGADRSRVLKNGALLGRIVDTFVLAQLRPLCKLAFPSVAIHHLRDANGDREADVVLESSSGQVVGIEIKAANRAEPQDARHLAWLRDKLGPAFVRGFVLHTGSMTFPLDDRLWAMPIAALWRQ